MVSRACFPIVQHAREEVPNVCSARVPVGLVLAEELLSKLGPGLGKLQGSTSLRRLFWVQGLVGSGKTRHTGVAGREVRRGGDCRKVTNTGLWRLEGKLVAIGVTELWRLERRSFAEVEATLN